MLELASRESTPVRDETPAAATAGAPRYRWRPLEDPLADAPAAARPRGLIAHLTAFFIAYHTA